MAYSESVSTGTEGGQFRWYVSMVRTYIGTATENYETWQLEGGVNRIATGITGYSRPDAYYELQAGTFAPGEGSSGTVAINFTNSVGRKYTASLPNLTIERQTDGSATSSTAYFYMFAGFGGVGETTASVGWATNTVSRQSLITATSGNIYETDNPTITFTNPAGFTTDVSLRLPNITSTTDYAVRTNVTSPYTWTLTTPERDAIRTAMTNTNQTDLYYYVKTNVSGGILNGSGAIITIDNRANIASPTFTTWAVADTTSAVAATSGGNPVMVQGKSIARATVTSGNKAVATKQATMSSYTFSVGPSSQSFAYSSGSTVTKDISLATDAPAISGSQTMSVAAVDSRTNSTIVSKTVLVLPYAAPEFYPTIKVGYTNRFDTSDGLSAILPGGSGTDLVSFSPLNVAGTDYNIPNSTTGVQYQLHKETINVGNPWNNIAFTQTPNTGVLTANATTLGNAILATMNGMGEDNSVTWYVLFKVVDKYSTVTYQATIDIGAPIFRIGVDGLVYNNEKQLLVLPIISNLADSAPAASTSTTTTSTPWSSAIQPLYIYSGTGVGNSSTIVFDVDFSWYLSGVGPRSWAMMLDGVAVGNAARPLYANETGSHKHTGATIVAKGVPVGLHAVSIELYGGGSTIQTDTGDYLSLVATEYANTRSSFVASDTGWISPTAYPGIYLSDSNWTNPANVYAADASFATRTRTGSNDNQTYKNFGFTIPAGAVVTKIEAKIKGKVNSGTGDLSVVALFDSNNSGALDITDLSAALSRAATVTLTTTNAEYEVLLATGTWPATRVADGVFTLSLSPITGTLDYSIDVAQVRVSYAL